MDQREPNPPEGRESSDRDDLGRIVQQLATILGDSEDAPVPLEGGITNRNYRARFAGRDYVIRVPGKNTNLLEIDRGAERIANEHAARIGIAPAVAATVETPQAIVTRFVEGRGATSEELREPQALGEVARALRAIHELGEPLPTDFNSFRIVEIYAETAAGHGATLPDAYAEAHARAQEIEAALRGAEHEPVPCHNDLLAANFIRGADRLWIVDWEYAGMGDRYFDLANFAVNNELDDGQQAELLEAYFAEPPTARRVATLRLMKFMSDFREAMWGVVQTALSELDVDFAGYANKHFDRMMQTAAHPDFESWLSEAREPSR
jgi:thiamine kinase-like enzyme